MRAPAVLHRRDKRHGFWALGVSDVQNGETVAEKLPDVGKAALDHDLAAVCASCHRALAHEPDVLADRPFQGLFAHLISFTFSAAVRSALRRKDASLPHVRSQAP